MKKKAALIVKGLAESPLPGDAPNPRYWEQGFRGHQDQKARTATAKEAGRDQFREAFVRVFGPESVRFAGRFQIAVVTDGNTWTIRQTSNGVRVVGDSPIKFSVGECSREDAAKVIISVIANFYR